MVTLGITFATLGVNPLDSDNQLFGALGGNVALWATLAVVVVLGAPVVEELFFRGLVQRALVPIVGTWGAIGVQAALFGLAHHLVPSGPGDVAAVVTLAAMGVVLGIAAHRRSVGTSVVGHSLSNAVSLAARVLG